MKNILFPILALLLAGCASCPAKDHIWGCAKGDEACIKQEKLRKDAGDQLQPNKLRDQLDSIHRETVKG